MRLDGQRSSSNIEDRRGSPGRGGGTKLGLGGLIVVVGVSWALGLNPLEVLSAINGGGSSRTSSSSSSSSSSSKGGAPPANDASAQFTSKVLASTEDVWRSTLPKIGGRYQDPKLVLFRDSVDSGCGFAEAAMGPFYCPRDSKVYLDMSFFDLLRKRFQAPGDFAQAYVIAHEVGHHVQNLLGTSDKVHAARSHQSKREENAESVRLELQADCYAGVWGYAAKQRGLLDAGDLEEALAAANAIGDDTLQRQARGRVVPDAFTHGTSAQRVSWFKRGFASGDPKQCDTFAASSL